MPVSCKRGKIIAETGVPPPSIWVMPLINRSSHRTVSGVIRPTARAASSAREQTNQFCFQMAKRVFRIDDPSVFDSWAGEKLPPALAAFIFREQGRAQAHIFLPVPACKKIQLTPPLYTITKI